MPNSTGVCPGTRIFDDLAALDRGDDGWAMGNSYIDLSAYVELQKKRRGERK